MGKGFLKINATTAGDLIPVENARVWITGEDGKVLYEASTDAGGQTQIFEIQAPNKELTLDPNYAANNHGYTKVNVMVSMPGFTTEHINGVQILDTLTKILPVHMKPLSDERNPMTDEYFVVPELGAESRGERIQRGPTGSVPMSPRMQQASTDAVYRGGMR